jgi:hypothetical protein
VVTGSGSRNPLAQAANSSSGQSKSPAITAGFSFFGYGWEDYASLSA